MILLEREAPLTQLNNCFQNVLNDSGCIVTVSGEAGIGKTSLVDLFIKQVPTTNIYWGMCDDLYTPRPLSPLYDIATQLKSKIVDQINSGIPRPSIFSNLIKELQANQPNVVVIEDLHWGDESTFDLLKFLGRRINKLKTLLIITYRDDEIRSDHPLKISLSTIPSPFLNRIKLNPLSFDAVSKLVASEGNLAKNIFDKTGGNPFLVTELMSNLEEGIPVTVKDLMNSKLIKLHPDARKVVELISVIPNRVEKWLLKELIEVLSIIEQPVEIGILKSDNESISFRHELGRMSVEETLSDSERVRLNSLVLETLLKQKNLSHFYARIIHHAEKAHNSDIIIKYVPLAADQASKLGAHYQASKHYLTVLKYSENLDYNLRIQFLEGRAYECNITGQIKAGIEACEEIIKILKEKNDLYQEAQTYRRLSRLLWYDGEDDEGETYLKKAISILENLNNENELAMAYSNLSQVYLCREDTDPAIKYGEKALELARKLNDLEIEIHSLCNLGSTKMFAMDEEGEELLKQSLELSLKKDFHDHASRAYANLGSAYLYRRNLSEAENYFSVGLNYCNDNDLYTHGLCISAETSKTKLYLGEWDEAVEYASAIIKNDAVPVIDRVISLCVLGVIRARRNDPGALKVVDQAYSISLKTGELMKIVSATSVLAECYWLNNKLDEVAEKIQSVYNKFKNNKNLWAVGELAFWLWKAGKLSSIPKNIADPFRLQIKGNWKKATKIWEELNCPYEQALALSEGDEEAMRQALEIFEGLGASATVQLIKQKMREQGIKSIPSGPRKSTRENFAGLTTRQLEVLQLVANGLSNSEIADNLYISSKTVDHHISAIFSKLNIHSRIEAASFLHTSSVVQK